MKGFVEESPKRIFYCGAFRLDSTDAAGLRVMAIGKSLRAAGWQVEFFPWNSEDDGGPGAQPDSIEGFPVHKMGEFRSEGGGSLRRLTGYLSRGSKTLEHLASIDVSNLDAVICYNGTSRFLSSMRKWSLRHGVACIADCTEWYNSAHLPGGRFGPVALDEWLRMRLVTPRLSKCIAISHYLDRYFTSAGMKTCRVPATIDLEAIKWRNPDLLQARKESSPSGKLQLIYAGVPGRKDRIAQVAQAASHVRDVHLTFVGPDQKELGLLLGADVIEPDESGQRIDFTGKVAADRVPALVAKADFSVIIRSDERYAQAGFPTKLVESLASGTPVITTVSGDEATVIEDGKNGFVLRSGDLEEVMSVLRRARDLSSDEKLRMRGEALRAARKFDYREYVEPLRLFLGK